MGLTGDYKSAIKQFDKAIQKDPRFKEAYIQRGLCYEYIHDYEKAINSYKALLSFDPKNTMAFYYIGLCKYNQSKLNDAIEYYNKALITKGIADPSDTSSVQILLDFNKNGVMLPDQAAFDVSAHEIYHDRGLAYYSSKQIRRAYRDFKYCVNNGHMLGESYYMMGLCWLAVDNNGKACIAFRQGVLYGDSLSIKAISDYCK